MIVDLFHTITKEVRSKGSPLSERNRIVTRNFTYQSVRTEGRTNV